MARILRGEVYWADLNRVRRREQQAGLRIAIFDADALDQLIDGLLELIG